MSFLLLHCVLWGHQREYPWGDCQWCLKPGDRSMFAPLPKLPVDIVHEPVPTYVFREPAPTGRQTSHVVLEPTAIIDPPRPAIEA